MEANGKGGRQLGECHTRGTDGDRERLTEREREGTHRSRGQPAVGSRLCTLKSRAFECCLLGKVGGLALRHMAADGEIGRGGVSQWTGQDLALARWRVARVAHWA